jgi:phosphinothricin acetyltransferase
MGYKTLVAIILDVNIQSIKLFERGGYTKWGALPKVAEFDGVEVGHVYYGKQNIGIKL